MAKAFLHARQHGFVVPSLDVDHAIGGKTGLGQSGCEQVRAGDAPEHLPFGAGRNTACKQRRRRPVDCAVPAAGNLVQCPDCQATSRQARVYLSDPEWEHWSDTPTAPFDLLDLCAQRRYGGFRPQTPS